jgi:hypothetical protein
MTSVLIRVFKYRELYTFTSKPCVRPGGHPTARLSALSSEYCSLKVVDDSHGKEKDSCYQSIDGKE